MSEIKDEYENKELYGELKLYDNGHESFWYRNIIYNDPQYGIPKNVIIIPTQYCCHSHTENTFITYELPLIDYIRNYKILERIVNSKLIYEVRDYEYYVPKCNIKEVFNIFRIFDGEDEIVEEDIIGYDKYSLMTVREIINKLENISNYTGTKFELG
jgi:hypothetical protein